jgi:hypothetical protein
MLDNLYQLVLRTATLDDMTQLIELEKEWPENTRASEAQLRTRIETFPSGFFVAQTQDEIIGSIICHPYEYTASNLSNFKSWDSVVTACYTPGNVFNSTNSLYVISGTIKRNYYGSDLFDKGIDSVVNLAKTLGQDYVIAGARIPGYARFIKKHTGITAENYVFQMDCGQYADPFIEKYRRLGFSVPDKNHVIPNYFVDPSSLNYSALVVRYLGT